MALVCAILRAAASVSTQGRVASSGTRVTGQDSASTSAAASGSLWMLASAKGVTFPRAKAPPMITTSATWPAMSGAARRASARLVSGPIAAIVTWPG